MNKLLKETLAYDDVLLVPQKSDVLLGDVDLKTKFSRRIDINIPISSSPMDTVTESKLAIALALQGGIGIIHKNLSIQDQCEKVKRVKRFENGFIRNPVTLSPQDTIAQVIKIRREHGYKKIPITVHNKLVGIITELDYIASDDLDRRIKDLMIPIDKLIKAKEGITLKQANNIIKKNRISVLPVTDERGDLVSMVTRSDLEKNEQYPNAAKDARKSLLVGAAISVGDAAIERATYLNDVGVDVLVVDTAHGHSQGVIETLQKLKKDKRFQNLDIVAGNVATSEGAQALIDSGADAVKVGVGPGSICTTRIIAGIGVPQFSALLEVVPICQKARVPLIADGGCKSSGDIVKALAVGADCVMVGGLLAGTEEAPGDIEYSGGRVYKTFRGMGSEDAMSQGSADRYGQAGLGETKKFVPEGVSGRVPYKGMVEDIVYQLMGGVRSGLGYVGAKNLTELRQKAEFIKITSAGLKESHPHDVTITKDSPNYKFEE